MLEINEAGSANGRAKTAERLIRQLAEDEHLSDLNFRGVISYTDADGEPHEYTSVCVQSEYPDDDQVAQLEAVPTLAYILAGLCCDVCSEQVKASLAKKILAEALGQMLKDGEREEQKGEGDAPEGV